MTTPHRSDGTPIDAEIETGGRLEREAADRVADGAPGPIATSWRWAPRVVQWTADRLERLWTRSVGALPAGAGRDTIVVACVIGYLLIDSARRALDAAVRRIHPAGEDGVGVNSLNDGRDAVELAFDVWRRGAGRLGAFIRYDPVTLATVQTWLELCLLPFSFALLFGVARHLRERERRSGDVAAANVMTVAMVGAAVYALIGAYNQVAELVILGAERPVTGWTGLLAITGVLRPAVLVFTLVPIVAVAIRPVVRERAMPSLARGFPTTYRVMIVVAAVHALLMLVSVPSAQIADALRLWELRPSLGVIGVVLTVVFALTLAVYAIRTGACARPTRRVLDRAATWIFVAVGLGLTGLGVALRFPESAASISKWSPSILAAGLITTGVGLLSLPLAPTTDVHEEVSEPPSMLARTTVPAVLAVAPLAALMIALVRAAIPAMIDRSSEVESETDVHLLVWVMVVVALAVAAYPSLRVASRRTAEHPAPQRNWRFRATGLVVFAVCAFIAMAVVADPVTRAPDLGVVGILAIFLSLLVVGFGGVAIALDGRSLPAALDFVGFRKVPIVIGVIVLGIVSQQLDDRGYHDIATLDGLERPDGSQLTIDDAYEQWLDAVGVDAGDGAGDEAGTAVPMFVVAAAGGGIKAAAFTASTLNCLFVPTGVSPAPGCPERSTWNEVFVASGASGGSVGIASVIAELERPSDPASSVDGWVSRSLGDDLLSATAAWQLLVEVPNAVLAFNPDDDRAAILEDSWRRQFDLDDDDVPFYVDRSEGWSGPVAFFSGTNLNDGCRVNVAAVRGTATTPEAGTEDGSFPTTARGTCTDRRTTDALIDQTDTRDLVDYLCDRANIDLATAAFLSARFPYVSPAGTASCEPADPATDPGTGEIAVGDGGYRDNSGADTIAQLWSILEPRIAAHNESSDTCIVPILVEISSGYAGLDAPDVATTASQFIAPALGAKAVFSDLSYGAIEQLAAEFTRPLAPDLEVRLDAAPFARHLRISLVEHPGVTAPLGWSLSPAAVEDFADQLQVDDNRAVIDQVATIVDAPSALTCARVG